MSCTGADGLRQTITVGGRRTAAEHQPADRFGHWVVGTATSTVTTFDSGRLRVVKDQAGSSAVGSGGAQGWAALNM
jgi:hypothetical protein